MWAVFLLPALGLPAWMLPDGAGKAARAGHCGLGAAAWRTDVRTPADRGKGQMLPLSCRAALHGCYFVQLLLLTPAGLRCLALQMTLRLHPRTGSSLSCRLSWTPMAPCLCTQVWRLHLLLNQPCGSETDALQLAMDSNGTVVVFLRVRTQTRTWAPGGEGEAEHVLLQHPPGGCSTHLGLLSCPALHASLLPLRLLLQPTQTSG